MELDKNILTTALEGLQAERQRVEALSLRVKGLLGAATPAAAPKRRLSPAARKRISASVKARWVKFRKDKADMKAAILAAATSIATSIATPTATPTAKK